MNSYVFRLNKSPRVRYSTGTVHTPYHMIRRFGLYNSTGESPSSTPPTMLKWGRGRLDENKYSEPDSSSPVHRPSQGPAISMPTSLLGCLVGSKLGKSSSQKVPTKRGNSNLPAASGFFTRLPWEIRNQILVEAFGGRLLHVELVFSDIARNYRPGDNAWRESKIENRRQGSSSGGMGKLTISRSQLDSFLRKSLTRGKGRGESGRKYIEERHVKWWGCVCRCAAPYQLSWWGGDNCNAGDICCWDARNTCPTWHPGADSECGVIGAMGWLLSCRQAYTEGIATLYSANTIRTTTITSTFYLPRFLPAPRLALIRCANLRWKVLIHGNTLAGTCVGEPLGVEFHRLLEMVCLNLPCLRSLSLSLEDIRTSRGEAGQYFREFGRERVLLPLDELVRSLGVTLREFEFGMTDAFFHSLKHNLPGECVELPALVGGLDRLWRAVGGGGGDDREGSLHLPGYVISPKNIYI